MGQVFCVVGRSKTGLSVMWVQGGTTLPSMEADLVSVSMNYYMAVHSDLKTLRNGVVFVIDTSNNPDKKVGNESKMQKFFSALPIRPQHFFIVGASWVKRLFINSLLLIARAFTS